MPSVFTAQAQLDPDDIGSQRDLVELVVDGNAIRITEAYEIREGVLSQPATWSLRLGSGTTAAKLIAQIPPRTPFVMRVGGCDQFTGWTDGVSAQSSENGGTSIELRGRDAMAVLEDSYVTAVESVKVATYAQLVWWALQRAGVVPKTQNAIDPNILHTDNNANRKIKGGVPIAGLLPHRTVEQILENVGSATTGIVRTSPQSKLNETLHRFVRRYIDRAGLFLWAGADGSYVLCAPDGNQAPTYVLTRGDGAPKLGATRLLSTSFNNDTTQRHTEVIVYGRGGGKKQGRAKMKGAFQDPEMIALGFNKPIVYRDVKCASTAEAIFFARRKIAEERRRGWSLEYTVAGHSLPFAGTNGRDRAIIIPDTVVALDDRLLGLSGAFYVETVVRRRSPETSTTIRLMRVEDLVFGSDDSED